MNKDQLSQENVVNKQREEDFYTPELPELMLSEFAQDRKRINELKKFPNNLSPLLQKFREIQNNRNINTPGIEKEYKRIEKELAEELMYCTNGKEIIEARIDEKDWVVLKVIPDYDFSDKDKIISFLKENNLLDLIIENEVRGAKINKKGQREDIKDIKFDEKRLYDLLNERIKNGYVIPKFFNYNLQRKLKIKRTI